MKAPLILASILLSGSTAWASDWIVTPNSGLQNAIDAAASGDRLLVQPGTYYESINLLGKAVEVIGVQGAEQTVLDANLQGVAVSMLMHEGPTTVLRGLTITRGSGGYGPGGVYANGSPTLEDCIIRGNVGRQGAGIHGNVIASHCVIENNTSSLHHGGGVFGAPTLTDCLIANNSCTGSKGGGLYITGGPATLLRCQILSNAAVLAGSRGGGIYVATNQPVTIRHCIVAGNQVSGGVFGSYGGGIFASSSTEITHSTIVGNRLALGNNAGGGTYGPANLDSCIVVANDGTQIEGAGSVAYSNVEGGAAGIGNQSVDPLFWDLDGSNFRLRIGSPCIDTGNPTNPLDPDGSRADMGALPYDSNYAPEPANECIGAINSTGLGATMSYSGSWSLSTNQFELQTLNVPPNQFGLYFFGPSANEVPVGSGFLCIGGPLYRLPVNQSDANGLTQYPLDFSSLPPGSPSLEVGSTWRFQLWYRDLGGVSNFSDALRVNFHQ